MVTSRISTTIGVVTGDGIVSWTAASHSVCSARFSSGVVVVDTHDDTDDIAKNKRWVGPWSLVFGPFFVTRHFSYGEKLTWRVDRESP